MNHPFKQNQQKSKTYTSTLISLFEKKGYQCEEINGDCETIYIMKSDLSRKEKSPERQPRLTIN
jgi:hypothetical protein